MSIGLISSSRVSLLQQQNVATSTIDSAQSQLQAIEQQLSTGKAVNQPSDNPSAAAVIQQLTQTLSSRTQYTTNITNSSNQLNEVDASLSDLSGLLTQATSTASANVSSTTTADARNSAASVIDSIYDQVLSTANKQFQGTYLFGTDDATAPPYTTSSAGVEFTGSVRTLSNTVDDGSALSFQVSATAVFGGESASVSTGTDVSPVLRATDRLIDLTGATNAGITLGSIKVSNGTTTANVDLRNADDVQDVVDDINAAGLAGVTASVGATGLKLTASGGANITVNDVAGGTTAAGLGILHPTASGANVAVTGADVGAQVTDRTPLVDLRGGAGLDATGFTLSNGTTSKTISMAGLTTVGDLTNAINTSGMGARASVNAAGTGIDLVNATQGSSLSVSENGGTTATELGFRTFSPTTKLASLNNGLGVSVPSGAQFTLKAADGSLVDVSLSGATTVQDAINQINTAAAGRVTASFATTGNGIVLTDTTTGAGTLSVTSDNAATTAKDLGLTTAASGGKITGTDVNPVTTPGLLTDLQNLRDALRKNDTAGITAAAAALTTDGQQVTDVRGTVGARVQELTSRSDSIATENVATRTLMSQFQDVDYTTAVTQFQTLQTNYQAALATTAKALNLSLLNYIT